MPINTCLLYAEGTQYTHCMQEVLSMLYVQAIESRCPIHDAWCIQEAFAIHLCKYRL